MAPQPEPPIPRPLPEAAKVAFELLVDKKATADQVHASMATFITADTGVIMAQDGKLTAPYTGAEGLEKEQALLDAVRECGATQFTVQRAGDDIVIKTPDGRIHTITVHIPQGKWEASTRAHTSAEAAEEYTKLCNVEIANVTESTVFNIFQSFLLTHPDIIYHEQVEGAIGDLTNNVILNCTPTDGPRTPFPPTQRLVELMRHMAGRENQVNIYDRPSVAGRVAFDAWTRIEELGKKIPDGGHGISALSEADRNAYVVAAADYFEAAYNLPDFNTHRAQYERQVNQILSNLIIGWPDVTQQIGPATPGFASNVVNAELAIRATEKRKEIATFDDEDARIAQFERDVRDGKYGDQIRTWLERHSIARSVGDKTPGRVYALIEDNVPQASQLLGVLAHDDQTHTLYDVLGEIDLRGVIPQDFTLNRFGKLADIEREIRTFGGVNGIATMDAGRLQRFVYGYLDFVARASGKPSVGDKVKRARDSFLKNVPGRLPPPVAMTEPENDLERALSFYAGNRDLLRAAMQRVFPMISLEQFKAFGIPTIPPTPSPPIARPV